MVVTSVLNETPSRLTLIGVEGEHFDLAPLQHKTIKDSSAFDFQRARRAGFVSTYQDAPRQVGEQISAVLLGGGFWVGFIGWIVSNLDPPWGLTPETWSWGVWIVGPTILLSIVTVMVIRQTNSISLVTRFAAQIAALAVILAIGLGLPAATIYFFGGGRALLAVPEPASLALFGRLIQLSFIATASLLPVLLFFLFDRFQLGTLRNRLYGNLFRLDRSVGTISEIDAKYGSQIREAYGSEDQGRGRLAPGSRWPVLVCAFVITTGWIVALAPVGSDFAPQNGREALSLLLPQPTALVFGFLGVYFFSLRLIAIRYARGDLKAKAYSHIMVRILIVAVLSWVLDAVFQGNSRTMLVLAFLFGITPDEFFTWLKEAFRGKAPASAFPNKAKLPLTDLEGIDLYDLGRLESEGIVNVEGLAHHELIDLIIETRVPVPRLIDWMDQAILQLHLIGGADAAAQTKLRDYGIRTATDLLQAWDGAEKRGPAGFKAFKQLLGGNGQPYRLEVIRDAMLDDEWMETVRCWREDAAHDPITLQAVPTGVEALERWADKQLELERYGAALSILELSLKARDTASTRRRMARIFATSPVAEYHDTDQSRNNARRAFELAPLDHAVISDLIDIYITIKDYEETYRMCDAALEIVSRWPNKRQKKAETKRLCDLQAEIKPLIEGGAQRPEAQLAQ